MKLYTVIAFHYVEDRLQWLEQTLSWLVDINTDHTKIVIQTNDINDKQLDTLKHLLYHQPQNVEIEVEPVRGLADPYMLTWAHKCRMLEFLETPYTHFAYLEDDMVLTDDLVNYWLDANVKFKAAGTNFIPGFVRVEYKNAEPYVVDIIRPYNVKDLIKVDIGGETYLSLPQPYQGCFLMDREMVEEHVKSASFSPETCRKIPATENDTRERANMGNMYENIPQGFAHRMLVPLHNFIFCWIHHCANTYTNTPNNPNGKLLADNVLLY